MYVAGCMKVSPLYAWGFVDSVRHRYGSERATRARAQDKIHVQRQIITQAARRTNAPERETCPASALEHERDGR